MEAAPAAPSALPEDDAEEEEEVVTLRRSSASASAATSASLSISSSPIASSAPLSVPRPPRSPPSSSPRRCVSRELLDRMPVLSLSTRYHEVKIAQPFGVFHVMQLLEKSIQVGALFSPKLYVPKEIWQQDHARLAGISIKVDVFSVLKQGLERMTATLPLSSPDAVTTFQEQLGGFLELAKSERLQLARSFPFLSVGAPASHPSSPQAVDQEAPPASAAAAGIGKLTNLAVGFGRLVKKQAIAAVERVGAAPSVTVTMSELEEYAATLCMFFNSTRGLEHLLGLRAGADGAQEDVQEVQASAPTLDPVVLERLKELAVFLDEVVVELVFRDVQSLLQTYLQRTTEQFGAFEIDPALTRDRHTSSVSA